ncbi:unnamed protein product [Lupinus luteus]|uniref:Uncharacterized protein n=1 Tax=Lupinus luteus TaxID=3873 RepID=A0AAV1X957_LUPLU
MLFELFLRVKLKLKHISLNIFLIRLFNCFISFFLYNKKALRVICIRDFFILNFPNLNGTLFIGFWLL